MGKVVDVHILPSVPDWMNSDLPAGIYVSGTQVCFYGGDKLYPPTLHTPSVLGLVRDERESNSGISIEDVIRLATALRPEKQ